MHLRGLHLRRTHLPSSAWAIAFLLIWGVGLGGLLWYTAAHPELLAGIQGATVGTLRGDVLGAD